MNKIKKLMFPLFIASITVLASTTYGCRDTNGSGEYNKIKRNFSTKDVVKDYDSCRAKCESINMFLTDFSKDISCSCSY